MLIAASAEWCDTRGSEYWLWGHVEIGPRQVELVKMILPGPRDTVMNALGLPGAFRPEAMIELAASVPSQREKLEEVKYQLASMALMRHCNRVTHADNRDKTGRDSGSPEVMERGLWVPHGAGILAVHRWAINSDGIGHATRVDRADGVISPVVSVPLTEAERERSVARMRLNMKLNAIGTLPSPSGPNAIFGLLHPTGEMGEVIEDLYRPSGR